MTIEVFDEDSLLDFRTLVTQRAEEVGLSEEFVELFQRLCDSHELLRAQINAKDKQVVEVFNFWRNAEEVFNTPTLRGEWKQWIQMMRTKLKLT